MMQRYVFFFNGDKRLQGHSLDILGPKTSDNCINNNYDVLQPAATHNLSIISHLRAPSFNIIL